MENLKFKLGDRVAYTGGYIGEKETGTIVGIDTRDTCVPYALCLDNGRGYRIIGQYKITTSSDIVINTVIKLNFSSLFTNANIENIQVIYGEEGSYFVDEDGIQILEYNQ